MHPCFTENAILGIAQDGEDAEQEETADDAATELWLRDAAALKSLGLHYLQAEIPYIAKEHCTTELLSTRDNNIEQAVKHFLDTHSNAF